MSDHPVSLLPISLSFILGRNEGRFGPDDGRQPRQPQITVNLW
jgi:hypothetical protein